MLEAVLKYAHVEMERTYNCENAIRRSASERIGYEPETSTGSLLIHIDFAHDPPPKVTRSQLFHMIQDGSLLSQFEEVTFTDEFRHSVTDISDLHFEDESCLPLVVKILQEFEKRLALRLSVSLEELIDLLFSEQSSTISLRLSPEAYRSISVPIDNVFEEIFPNLSELLIKPLDRYFMTLEMGK